MEGVRPVARPTRASVIRRRVRAIRIRAPTWRSVPLTARAGAVAKCCTSGRVAGEGLFQRD